MSRKAGEKVNIAKSGEVPESTCIRKGAVSRKEGCNSGRVNDAKIKILGVVHPEKRGGRKGGLLL